MESGFDILGEITSAEIIAVGRGIRDFRRAEIHWYEAHGIGKKDFKIKRYID